MFVHFYVYVHSMCNYKRVREKEKGLHISLILCEISFLFLLFDLFKSSQFGRIKEKIFHRMKIFFLYSSTHSGVGLACFLGFYSLVNLVPGGYSAVCGWEVFFECLRLIILYHIFSFSTVFFFEKICLLFF